MTKQSYVITKNRGTTAFFTATSSYDAPAWVNLKEAKQYPTAELAEMAAKKLYKRGAYEARVVSLQEATMALELPDEDVSADPHAATVSPEDADERDTEMVAVVQGSDSEHIHQGDEDPEMEALVDDQLKIADDVDRDALSTVLDAEGELEEPEGEQVAGGPDGAPIVGESQTMPARPPLDAKPSENSNTGADLPAVDVIKYKDPSQSFDGDDTNLNKSGAWPNNAVVKTPAHVMKDLKDAIAAHQRSADNASRVNDAKASFCMTVVAAFEELLADLEEETAEGIKAAQIHVTSWMNPITALLPVSVQQFVMMGGRKSTLKNFFDSAKRKGN